MTPLSYPQPRLISSENVKISYFKGLGFNIGVGHTYKLGVKMLEINHIFHIRGPKILTPLSYPQPRLISSENVKNTYFRGLGFNIGVGHTYKLCVKMLEINYIFHIRGPKMLTPLPYPQPRLISSENVKNTYFRGLGFNIWVRHTYKLCVKMLEINHIVHIWGSKI